MEPFGDPEARIRDLERGVTSPYYAPPQGVVRRPSHPAALWLIPLIVVVVGTAAVAGVVMLVDTGGAPGQAVPIAGGGGPLDPPPVVGAGTPTDVADQTVTVESGAALSISGVETSQTVVCDEGTVTVSGVRNTVEVQGPCASVNVSGVENTVSVESAGSIRASGFDNRVTYRTGEPEIAKSGVGNSVVRG